MWKSIGCRFVEAQFIARTYVALMKQWSQGQQALDFILLHRGYARWTNSEAVNAEQVTEKLWGKHLEEYRL